MVTKKRVKLISVILAMLATASLICASVITAVAEEEPTASFEYIVEQYGDFVNASGIIEEESLVEGGNFSSFITNPLEEEKILQAKEIVRLAEKRVKFEEEEFSVERICKIAEPKRVESNELLVLREEALSLFKVDGAIFSALNWKEQVAELEQAFDAKRQAIIDILEADKKAYNDYVSNKAKSVYEHYEELLTITNLTSGTEYTVYGYYSGAKQSQLRELLNELVEKVEGEAGDVWSFKSEDNNLEYDPKNVEGNKQIADLLAESDIKALDGVPKNDFEEAHQAFMDFINIKDEAGDKFNPSNYTDEIDRLKDLGAKALSDYEKRFSADLRNTYETEYFELKNAIDEIGINPNYVAVKVYSISDKHNVVTIVAKYASGTDKGKYAQVLPESSKLFVYAGANSSAKKNVSSILREVDKSLSVAYNLTLRVEKDGYKYFKLPTEVTNEKGRTVRISYEITINLEGLYNSYFKEDGFQKNKLTSITSADEVVSKLADQSICYAYANGEAQKLDYKLEGGQLVFTTTSHLNNLCIAGFDLASFVSLTNPIFWVVCLIALIILIILICTIVKHVRYTIKFYSNGGSRVRRIRAAKGEYFVMPNDPVKPNYIFAGWYTDKELKHKFFGNCMTRRRRIKLYAKWSAPVTVGRLVKMYDSMRDLMRSYKKESFKAVMGLSETEKIATMYFMGNHIQLNGALDPEELQMEGFSVFTSKEKKFAEVPAQLHVSTEESYRLALELINRVLLNKGLQKIEDYVSAGPSSEEERKNGFTYVIRNAKVASTAEDYFDLLRIALKSYAMEENTGKFKPGDKVTLARIYIEKEVACLYLPAVKGEKALKGKRKARFADTPVEFKILVSRDMLEAYELIDKVMKHNGLATDPENANDLKDIKLPETNGFAYTLVF